MKTIVDKILEANSKPETTIKDISRIIWDLIDEKKIQEINSIFLEINPSLLTAKTITILFRSTFAIKDYLKDRENLLQNPIIIKTMCKDRGDDAGIKFIESVSINNHLNPDTIEFLEIIHQIALNSLDSNKDKEK